MLQTTTPSTAGVQDNGDSIGLNRSDREPIAEGGWPVLGQRYEVPARHGRAVRLNKGQSIKIINTHGSQVCDTWAFKADDLSEFMSMEHARAVIDRIIPVPGDPLATNRRRAILTLLEDTSPGVHDTLIAACDAYRYQNLGVTEYHDNCADNMRLALKAIGMRAREVPQPLNLWMNIPVGRDNGIQ
ncbi:MAG: urea carboxylase-associated family protein, partial [Comamonas sp.]|nr:urea carboxylase-associated family protein [Candidatus Comamonas equi]